MNPFRDRLIDPNSPDRRPRRAAYALPALFTAGNLFLGFLAIMKSIQGALLASQGSLGHNHFLESGALMVGVAVFLDGLDGRIARLTNTVSEFGKELDSLADVITFGVAPSVLAWVWGFQFMETSMDAQIREQIHGAGYFVIFLFLLCGASRLARFNIQTNPVPKNPGKPDRKYFVGLPIPAGAAMVAAIIYAAPAPLERWMFSAAWVVLLALLSFLMVSTWRYRSFKDLNLLKPTSPLSVVLLGSLIWLIWSYSQPVLLGMTAFYVGSGIVIRAGGIVRRKLRPVPSQPQQQAGHTHG